MPEDAHYRTILDSIADGVFTVDLDWRVTSFNRAAEEITGVARDQALGQKCHDVFRADVCQAGCVLRRTIDTGTPIVDQRITILTAEGRELPVSISTAVLRDDAGNITGGAETFRDLSALEMLRREIAGRYGLHDIITRNHRLHEVLAILPDIALSGSTVLIEGPSGSGKELFARAIHDLSARAEGPFIAVNCGALPDTLLESELFGYRRGAFTGAQADKPGRFALAEGGTLFLDEIGDISSALQVKLLRVLQEKEYQPLGATESINADVRIVTATNRSLADQVAVGAFRDDLFYRLNVVRIELPPLSERREDIPLLLEHFIEQFNVEKDKRITRIDDEAFDLLIKYPYPGNVRELRNIVEHAFVLCHGQEIKTRHLPQPVRAHGSAGETAPHEAPAEAQGPAGTSLEDAEARAIREALARNDAHRSKTAAELGIHPTTLWRKMKRLGINV